MQPAVSAGRPHSLWENENTMQSEASLLSQHLNGQSITEARGLASPTSAPTPSAVPWLPTLQTPSSPRDSSYPLGI